MQYKNNILYNDIEYIRVCVAYNRPNNLILAPSPPLSLYTWITRKTFILRFLYTLPPALLISTQKYSEFETYS